ncbi:MAG: BspA family leucine-rich repeat surface protein, partial [Bacteroidetes bacterium]|nr:BspA family leucine-rich repeat surface protein [Bacteroidota bacterium]
MKQIFTILLLVFTATITVNAQGTIPFVTTWQTYNAGTSNSTSITIPTIGGGYSYDVDWNNDGIYDTTGITGNITHDYGIAGTYTVAIKGSFPRIYFNNGGDHQKILSIEQWGNIAWASMGRAFMGCSNLVGNATDAPDLSAVTDMSYMFYYATAFNGNIGNWNTSAVKNMSFMFYKAAAFNQNIGSWNTSAVTNMSRMFRDATSFNQNIGSWNTSAVTDMMLMFFYAGSFNQNIDSWNTSALTNMFSMFAYATSFNQNIGKWNIGGVSDINDIFYASGISQTNYDSILIAWNAAGYTNKNLRNASPLKYCAGAAARASLLTKGWSITGDALLCPCTPTTGTFTTSACNSYTWAAKGNKVYTASNNTDTIHLTNAGGCDSLVTLNLTFVSSLPSIIGASSACVGSTTTLSNTLSGGVWSSISGRASVNASGEVTGTSGGTATIKYAKAGCGSVTKTVTVNALPATPTIGIVPGTPGITGSGGYCKNKTFSVVGKPTGGTWSSTGAFAITNLGVVTTDATPGAGSVSYAYTNSNGCTSS